MKKINIIICVLIATQLSVTIYGCIEPKKTKAIELKVGQTWKYSYNSDNPYEKSPMIYRTIIDLEGNYVQYVQDGGDTLSDSQRNFVVNSVLFEQCK